MPASTNVHYKDPKTGKIIILPQLFPHAVTSGGISQKEVDELVREGIIPKNVHEEDAQNQKKMKKIREKLEKGEKVSSSELPKNPFTLAQFLIKNKASVYGENVLKKIFENLISSDPNIIWLSFIKEAVVSISSKDPMPIHFATARNFLKKKNEIEEPSAIDVLARKIVDHCIQIQGFKTLNHPIFEKVIISPEDLEIEFEDEKGEMLSLDLEFTSYIKQFGKTGQTESKKIRERSKEIYSFYKKNSANKEAKPNLWSLWVPESEKKEQISQFLKILALVSWDFSCASILSRKTKQSPAIAKPIIENVKSILNPKEKKKFFTKSENFICTNSQGQPLIIAPAIDSEMITLFQKGVENLSTLTGHRILRWQIKQGFEKWASEEKDFRVIELEGGYSHIAKAAGCASTKEIAKVKAILHAQAYGQFVYRDGSRGNMIILRILNRYKNKEPSKISITLGDMLLPGYVFNFEKKERRLIPIGDLPPLYGSKNTHAQQAHLQLLVFEEFSNQSVKLAKEGYVVITKEKWEQMAFESGLDPKKVTAIITHWSQQDLPQNFLDKQGDEYRLTSYYNSAQKFLLFQGKQKITNSERGKKSAVEKKKRIKKR